MACRICGNEKAGFPLENMEGNVCYDCNEALYTLKHGDKKKVSGYFQQYSGKLDKEMSDYLAQLESQNDWIGNARPKQKMKCENCGAEFTGDFCPHCKASATITLEQFKAAQEPQGAAKAADKIFKSKRLIAEIVGVILLVIFMFSTFGRVSKSDHNQLQSSYDELSRTNEKSVSKLKETESKLQETESKLEESQNEYAEYKKRMEPYEELEAAEAKARKEEADKAAAEKKAADEKAAAEKKAAEEKAAAEKKAAEDRINSATISQKNALGSAKNYLSFMPFSHSGLIKQLEYEGYSVEEATFAADNCGADWNEQAALAAENYIDTMSFSRQGLIDQLVYEGFSQEQAEYGVTAVGY